MMNEGNLDILDEFADAEQAPNAPSASPRPRPPLMKEKVFHVPVWAWITGLILAGTIPFGMSMLTPPPASQAFDLAPASAPVRPDAPIIAQPEGGLAPSRSRNDGQRFRDLASPPAVTFSGDGDGDSAVPDASRETVPAGPAGVGSNLLVSPAQTFQDATADTAAIPNPRLAPPEGAQPVLLASPDTGEMKALLDQIKQSVSDLREQQSGLVSRIEALGERIDKIQSHMETTDKAVRNTWWIVHKTLGPQYEEIKAREARTETPAQAAPAQAAPQRRMEAREEATAQSVKERAERLKQSVLESKRRAALVGWSVAGIGQGFAALRAPDGKDYVVRPGDRLGDAVVERIDGRAVVTSFGEIR